jgi:hypothetical protein
MSKIEEALLKASEMREFDSADKSNQLDVFESDTKGKKWFYKPSVTVIAILLVIMSINTNKAAEHPTNAVTKAKSQGFVKYNKTITDNKNVAHIIYTIQAGSFIQLERAEKHLDFIAQRLDEKELDYLRIEKIGNFYSTRLGKFENSFNAEKLLQSIKSHLPTAIKMKAYIKDERIVRLYKDAISVDHLALNTFNQ